MSKIKYAGKVYLVGAGPGDPGLLTVKGKTLLEQADVVVYDALVSPEILGIISPHAEKINAGKRKGRHSLPNTDTTELLRFIAETFPII
ncbi:MAG: SAM-dependent methyltransferase, partial [Pleurocapsa sp.]